MHWLLESLTTASERLALGFVSLLVRIFPRRFLLSLSAGAADLGFYLFHSFRKRSIVNLSFALGEQLDPPEVAATVRRSARNFFRDLVELAFAFESSLEEIRAEIPLRGREHLEAALAKGKGAIALSAHLGNFFLLGTRLAAEGFPTNVLIKPPRNGGLARLRDDYRRKIGQRTIPARPRRQALQRVTEVLRRNEVAVVIADEFRSGNGVYVPFFGRTVLARRGPATLAMRTGAALVPVCLIREPGGMLTLKIEPEIELSRSGRIPANVRENTLRITQWLERTVRSYPDQWNWMSVHWQRRSLGAGNGKEQGYKEATEQSRQAETK